MDRDREMQKQSEIDKGTRDEEVTETEIQQHRAIKVERQRDTE